MDSPERKRIPRLDDYKVLNEILVRLFRSIMDVEEKAIITQEFQDITNNDMHVIEAIGMGTPKNMSSIAKELSVTVGTLTIAMNSLVKQSDFFRVSPRLIMKLKPRSTPISNASILNLRPN